MSDITVRRVLSVLGFKVDDAKLKAANKEVDKTKREVAATDKAVKQLEGEFGKVASAAEIGFGKASRAAKTLGGAVDKAASQTSKVDALNKSFGKLTQFLGAGAFTGLAVGAAGFVGDAADRVNELDAAAAALPFTIDAARAATRDLVSDFDLTTAGAAAFRAEIVTSGEEFGTFSRDVARLAAASGDQVATAVGRMVDELKNGSTALLEQYGVTVDAEGAIESYARAHGRLVEDLTDSEKKQAVVAEAMRLLHERAEGLGNTLDTLGSKVQRAQTKLTNLGDSIKRGVVVAAGEAVGALESLGTTIGETLYSAVESFTDTPLQNLEQRLQGIQVEMKGVGTAAVDTIAQLALGSEALDDYFRTQNLARGKAARDAAVQEKRDADAAREAAARELAANKGVEVYQMTDAELRAMKRFEQEQRAHEEEAAYQRLFGGMGPEPATKKGGGKGAAPPPYQLRTLADIAEATGSRNAESMVRGILEFRKPEKRKATREEQLLGLITSGQVAGVGVGPAGGAAQGLGTRIINIDARITADIDVVAPEGLVGAGEVEGRRVAQTLGRDIAEQLDPYFSQQAIIVRKAVEG